MTKVDLSGVRVRTEQDEELATIMGGEPPWGNTCNYCTLKAMKRQAKKEGNKITVLHSLEQMGGVEVFVHPKNVRIGPDARLEKNAQHKFWKCWFMELPNSCAC